MFMLHICFNKMLSGCVVCLLKYSGMKCPRLGTKCPSTKCTGTKCPGTKCPGTKCAYLVKTKLTQKNLETTDKSQSNPVA